MAPLVGERNPWLAAGVCCVLALAIWTVFGQTRHFGFVNCDDPDYVYNNPEVAGGLTWSGVIWAFTHVHAFNWHPLTWISHMLDCQLYGLNPGGPHLTNVLLHTVSAILLFLVLRRMTGALWPSAWVAAVFAIHPLRVESVAWVAERKDVLSGVFFMFTLGAYAQYVEAVKTPTPRSKVFYALTVLLFALGLMCKPMLVTLPLVLLLLDYWPLNRYGDAAERHSHFPILRRLVLEKLPLFALAILSCIVTLHAQTGAIQSLPLAMRLGNAVMAYADYMGQMFWPLGLAASYPYVAPNTEWWKVALSLVILGGISIGVFIRRRRHPWLLTGWLWYLIMLLPVIGIFQVGYQAHADRYTYLPQIGLYLMLTWAAANLSAGWRYRRAIGVGGGALILIALILCARVQTGYWRDSETLWGHTLACTSDNAFATYSMGNTLFQKGDAAGAIACYQEAIRLNPDFGDAYNNMGNALLQQGKLDQAIAAFQKASALIPQSLQTSVNLGNALFQKGDVDDAIACYQKVLQAEPDYVKAHINLGVALMQKGRIEAAVAECQKALQIEPDNVTACIDLGNALVQEGNVEGAIVQYQKALQIKPDNMEARYNLGNTLLKERKPAEAIAQFQQVLQIQPDSVGTQIKLAWLLATYPEESLRNGKEAMELARRANELTSGGNPVVLETLAAAYAEAGQFPDAVESARQALALAQTQSNTALAGDLETQMKLYKEGRPFHSPQ
jgi:protein O-mannosyl-transferase